MIDRFLEVTRVTTEQSAMSNAIQAALQRNKTYRDDLDDDMRTKLRAEWARIIRDETKHYTLSVSDLQHCEAVRRISDELSTRFAQFLSNGRLRYGTSQKALNLYLKFLWRLDKVVTPPHCPVDASVLQAGGIDGSWTEVRQREAIHGVD